MLFNQRLDLIVMAAEQSVEVAELLLGVLADAV
jgi:hypothetical protein